MIHRRATAASVKRQLIIMAKLPEPGRAKTRLGRKIGPAKAAYFYRHNLELLLQRLAHHGTRTKWQAVLAITPDSAMANAYFRRLARKYALTLTPQGHADLGGRMASLLARQPVGSAVLIGSDIPGVTHAMIIDAFAQLRRADHVFGPARDGGFWLVGSNAPRHLEHAFTGIGWSQPTTLAQVLSRLNGLPGNAAEPSGRKVGFTATLSDVDEPADLTVPDNAAVLGRLVI